MLPEQREVLDEIIVKIRSGRMKRRTFLERAIAVGLSSGAAISLLEACGGTTNTQGGNQAAKNIVWQSENDSTPTYKTLADNFNKSVGQQKGIHVTWQQGPTGGGNELLTKYTTMLRARNSSIDVMSIDIIYPAQFAASQWTVPITDEQWPVSEREKYLQGPIKGCTYQGKIWAAPFRTDLGLLYYRTDLVDKPPETWDQLYDTAKSVSPSKVKYGYVWQGSQYEGLVCDFVEVLHSYGGYVLDPNDSTKVTVNSAQGKQALEQMVRWVGTISPAAVTTYTEEPARLTWQNGDSAYMRNWPYAYVTSTQADKIKGKFDIASLPSGGGGNVGHSAIGGWNLAINAYSKNQPEAWEFIKYMLQTEAQKQGAIGASWTVTLQSAYDDSEVQSKQPLFTKLKPILQNALPRPVSPRYSNVSDAIQKHVFAALKKQVPPEQALSALENDLKPLVTSS
jgi:multiple sugar transport system substrate-binding protein